ncbi:MAG TPA: hypothetical protein VM432_13640 [Bdellovibrionales bacterium]|nr:hypothetical protein [Bdellovibrionales bacterium]
MARATKTMAPKKKQIRRKHEDRVNPDLDHVPGHKGYTLANRRDIVGRDPRPAARSGTRVNSASVSSRSRRTVDAEEPVRRASMKGRSNTGGRGTVRRSKASASAARAGLRSSSPRRAAGRATNGRRSARMS